MRGSNSLQFQITNRDPESQARCGVLTVPHGDVETPVFMPVGTQATVKAVTPRDLEESGATMILANTYHLALRPGAGLIERAGGLHRFMAWPHPLLTDSGGYQVFSLATTNRITDDGVTFRSHIDGASVHLTPELSIEIQNALGADVVMAFDECAPYPSSRAGVAAAVERTARWAERSVAAHRRDDQALFGIVQGGVHSDLRVHSAGQITALDFPGYAIGGVSVGETPEEMLAAVAATIPFLPADRPRYVMGVGRPVDLVDMIAAGVDMFDCVIPTRNARNADLFTAAGILKMRNAAFAEAWGPVEEHCSCYTCRHFSRAYLRHLYSRGEMLAGILGTIHNLTFMQRLTAAIRKAIREGRFGEFRQEFSTGRWGLEA